MFPVWERLGVDHTGLPHASGGVSRHVLGMGQTWQSSPREWGCFLRTNQLLGQGQVFPTRVGVFPGLFLQMIRLAGLPHASGGVSHFSGSSSASKRSSPREWGCFQESEKIKEKIRVFPTRVGVFLECYCLSNTPLKSKHR